MKAERNNLHFDLFILGIMSAAWRMAFGTLCLEEASATLLVVHGEEWYICYGRTIESVRPGLQETL